MFTVDPVTFGGDISSCSWGVIVVSMLSSKAMQLLVLILTTWIHFILSHLKPANGGIEELIPLNFPDREVEHYTIRYIDNSSTDTLSCLGNQSFPAGANVSACKSLAYSLETTVRGSFGRSVRRRVMNLVVLIDPGTYGLERGITVERSQRLILAKHPGKDGDVVFRCGDTNDTIYNLDIKYSSFISINGILGTGCGPRGAAVRFTETQSVTIVNSAFRDNTQCGIIMSHCDDVLIENTEFVNNTAASEYTADSNLESTSFRVAGGLTVAYRNSSVPSSITVRNCSFESNRAIVSQVNNMDSIIRPSSYVPRGHGGGILAFFRNSSNHNLFITESTFNNNVAEFAGGAVAVLFYRSPEGIGSTNNSVVIEKSMFVNNTSPSGVGGAIGGSSFEAAYSNSILIKNSTILKNSAATGGGGFSFIEDNGGNNATDFINNRIILENTKFEDNTSPKAGGAISLIYFSRMDQTTSQAVVSNCKFLNNQAHLGGGIHSLHYAMNFRGRNIFIRNSNSAWHVTRALIICQDHVLFKLNQAQYGGAVSLKQEAIIEFRGIVNITFVRNSAAVHGGAVFVSHSPLTADLTGYQLLFQRCFVRHNHVSGIVSFIDNAAGEAGAAIFATEINTCSYILNATEQDRAGKIVAVKFYEEPYFFKNNTITDLHPRLFVNESFATEPFVLVTQTDTVIGAPGQTLHLNLRCVDQINNYRPCFWSSNFVPNVFALPEDGDVIQYQIQALNYYNITEEQFYQNCSKHFTRKLRFTVIQGLTNDLINVTEITLNITCCNPGYSLVNGKCILNRNRTVIFRADSNNKYFYIKPLHYVMERDGGTVVSARMPLNYQKCTRLGNLSGCLFQYDNPNNQCRNNRSGFLCGVCQNGTTVDATLSSCVTCFWWHTLIHILFVIVWIVFCVIVLVYNIGISNNLKGFVFYIQVVGYIYDYTSNGIVWDNHLSKIGYFAYIPFCIFPGLSALAVVSRGFFIALLAILTIFAYIISARFLKKLSNRNSFDGIWFISFFIYKLAADSCYGILLCQKVNGGDSHEYMYHFNGSHRCFSRNDPHYLAFGVIAILIGIIVLIFPLFILFISFKRFLLTQNITDVLNKDIRPSRRWWSSFDLYRRLLFTISILFFHYVNPFFAQLALFFSSLLVFVIFAFADPYNSRIAYYIEAALLLDLILVSAIFLNTDSQIQRKLVGLTSTLLALPYVVAVLYFTGKLAIYLWNKYCPESWHHSVRKGIKNIATKLHKAAMPASPQEYHPQKKIVYMVPLESSLPHDVRPIPFVEGSSPAHDDDISRASAGNNSTFQSFADYREELLSS